MYKHPFKDIFNNNFFLITLMMVNRIELHLVTPEGRGYRIENFVVILNLFRDILTISPTSSQRINIRLYAIFSF